MNKYVLICRVAMELAIRQVDAKQLVNCLLDHMTETLVKEGRLELRNFGVFEVHTRRPRRARNPKTGEKVMVGERRTVRFKAGKGIEEKAAELKELEDNYTRLFPPFDPSDNPYQDRL